jgi:hypothetical protein
MLALGKHVFLATMREWQIAQGHISAIPPSVAEAIRVRLQLRMFDSEFEARASRSSCGL